LDLLTTVDVIYSLLLYLGPSDSSVSENAGVEPMTVATKEVIVATLALTVRRSNDSARSPPSVKASMSGFLIVKF
jgi:hypothetical protein